MLCFTFLFIIMSHFVSTRSATAGQTWTLCSKFCHWTFIIFQLFDTSNAKWQSQMRIRQTFLLTCVAYHLYLLGVSLNLQIVGLCVCVCERRVTYQSALYLKVIRILHFSLKPCRKTQGGGGGDRLIEE